MQLETMQGKTRRKIRKTELDGIEGAAFRVLLKIDELKTAGKDATIYALAKACECSPKKIQHQIDGLKEEGLVLVERRINEAFAHHLTPEAVEKLDANEEQYQALMNGAKRGKGKTS